MSNKSFRTDKGAALIEFCVILPLLVVMLFGIIDFGLFIRARLIITSLTREGGSLASREIKPPDDLITMLQKSASPLDMTSAGKICITYIKAGLDNDNPNPTIDSIDRPQKCAGGLGVGSSTGASNFGLTSTMYGHLVFKPSNQTADINGVTIVETFYKYKPITPLPGFISNILLKDGDGEIIGSRAVFCTYYGGES